MDETFHLTAVDVRRYDFGRALRGYEPERVEQFREQVAEEIERLTRLSQDFEQKAKGFHEQLRAFRERDKALNDALVSAQQLRVEMRETAERESAVLLREAQSEAERLIDAARNEVHLLEAHLAEIDRARRTYLTQMRMTAERHLAEIESQESAAVGQPVSARASLRMSKSAVPVTGDATEG
ncbi:MAG TPA: DivIVA domain-containing protein [Gemmatimonadaceae bacterium]